ncbi:MAG TPA: TolC family protein [Tepidisphaeraceae bacterium]|jgi:outer membrane protein TolC
MRCWLTIFCVSLLLLAGCRVDSAREAAIYRDLLAVPGPQPTTMPDASVSLPQVLRIANLANEDIAVQGEAYYRVLNERRRTVANFLPTLSLVPTYARRDATDSNDGGGTNGGVSVGGGQGGSSQNSAFDVSADLNINLFNGFADVNRYWATTYRIEQAKQQLLDLQQTVLLDVARVYYQVLISEASLNVIEQSLAAQEERFRDTRGRFEAGLARPLDVSQTEAQVAQTRVQWVDARRDIDTGRVTLSQLAATPLQDRVLGDGLTVPETPQSLDHYLSAATTSRNDLRGAISAIDASQREIKVAVAQYYPSVTLDFSAFLYRESVPDERRWEALLGVNLPIFAAGRIRADVLEAWSFFREAQIVRNRVERQVRSEVRSAYIELQASTSRLAELKKQRDAAEAAYQLAEQSYKAGIATNLDRLIAQSTLLTAQLGFSQEFFNRKVRYLNLLRVAGLLRNELESWR